MSSFRWSVEKNEGMLIFMSTRDLYQPSVGTPCAVMRRDATSTRTRQLLYINSPHSHSCQLAFDTRSQTCLHLFPFNFVSLLLANEANFWLPFETHSFQDTFSKIIELIAVFAFISSSTMLLMPKIVFSCSLMDIQFDFQAEVSSSITWAF